MSMVSKDKIVTTLQTESCRGITEFFGSSGVLAKLFEHKTGKRSIEIGPVGEGFWRFERRCASLRRALEMLITIVEIRYDAANEVMAVERLSDVISDQNIRVYIGNVALSKGDDLVRAVQSMKAARRTKSSRVLEWARSKGYHLAPGKPFVVFKISQDHWTGPIFFLLFAAKENEPQALFSISATKERWRSTAVFFESNPRVEALDLLHLLAARVSRYGEGNE
ncbi:MAG: hypothetical protein ABL898_16560 [Hyphomicrobiaceae bacterium]